MQLFFLDHIDRKAGDIIIDNPEIRQQAKKVLRLQGGDQIFVQDEHTRYDVEIIALRDMKIFGTIKNTITAPARETSVSMIIAMPNKWDKVELIVQKLSEIGINEIIFRPSERSVIKQRNSNKEERLKKIAKEALEQSRGRHLTTVTFASDIHEHLKNNRLIVFDGDGNMERWKHGKMKEGLDRPLTGGLYGLIGPEGGRGPKDYALFQKHDIETKSLGATVLRTETAAIVAGRLLKNGL